MMRRMSKKVGKLAGSLAAVIAIAVRAGCGGQQEVKMRRKNIYHMGLSQFAEHGSLDNCREGFVEGLKEKVEGKNLKMEEEVKNAAADMGTASQIADRFVSDQMNLICDADPGAQAAFNAGNG